ncbi:phosphatidylserine decarboxylase [Candidatus Rhabdochlamydia porcellionis]|jgi:phosphatidylserine decarboxylase|uniref:Phosphatidylserine decarboxylase proenzyme n=1 Tax=Candidatus Rhabdochlamydia porcellionis TaxID=225148 RepID=A0ABX8Z110_9BACT|nr:phosphatidylserine decarboxylase [Candidatus Rhabdochlamydia porcellionis]QZA59370.1 Phosphatidylserine decarboxylase proenzyme 2 [Candidatus Rhabdochlamydia porcellionis]
MPEIIYLDRLTKKKKQEKVYGKFFIDLLYKDTFLSRILSFFILPLIAKLSFFSRLYGFFQKSSISRCKIIPFIKKFEVDTSEFLEPVSHFHSFNDFFIRRLKPEARPINQEESRAILPTDARYLVFPDIREFPHFFVKGEKFSLKELLKNEELVDKYKTGSMVIARLCPVDYHRFHFPCRATPGKPRLINGALFSVNPVALKRNIKILSENKRMITMLATTYFGNVLYLEVGATHVGSIHQTFLADKMYEKGDEKGYFSFGGSCLILLFEPNRIYFDQDLLKSSAQSQEVRGLMGQSLGSSIH